MNDLHKRVLTAAFLVPGAIAGVLYLPTAHFALALAAVCLIGLFEWCRLIGWRPYSTRLLAMLPSTALFMVLWVIRNTPLAEIVLLLGVTWWPLAALWLRNHSFAQRANAGNQTIKWLGGLLTVVPAWTAAVLLHQQQPLGTRWVLFVLALVWCADIAAYFSGRRFGRTKLAPRISPGKTRAGVRGALAGCTLYAIPAGLWLGVAWPELPGLLLLCWITVGFSIVGDLFESMIKRHSNHKDSGRVLPGHGGVFDRLDSLFAALPVFAAGKLLLGL